MQVGTIRSISMKALADALGAPSDSASADARVAAVAAENPTFADAYPTLLRMCCEATTEDRQESVRHFLPMMLLQLQQVRRSPDNDAALHTASVHVGKVVGARYLPAAATAEAAPADADVPSAKRKR